MEPFLFILAGLAALIALAWLFARLPGVCNREAGLRILAKEHGLMFDPGPAVMRDEPYATFAFFRIAGDQKLRNTIQGTCTFAIGDSDRACAVIMGDVEQEHPEYEADLITGIAPGIQVLRVSYLLLQLPFDDLPSIRIRHRRGPGGAAVLAGREEIDFEWNEFNRDMQVTCTDRRFAYSLISKRMMEFLHGHPGYPLAIENGWICLADGHSQWSPTTFHEVLGWMREFLERWPRHLVPHVAE